MVGVIFRKIVERGTPSQKRRRQALLFSPGNASAAPCSPSLSAHGLVVACSPVASGPILILLAARLLHLAAVFSYGPQLAFYKWAARQVSRDESCEPGEGGRIKLMPDKFCARTDKLPEPTPAHALVGRVVLAPHGPGRVPGWFAV